MRVLLTALLLVLGWPSWASEKESSRPTGAHCIAELIRQLGNEDFWIRERASRQLVELGLASEPQLTVARRASLDPEVCVRAERILQSFEGLIAQRDFLNAMKGPWHKALTEGRLAGPLLGASAMNAQPLPVDEGAFGTIDGPPIPRFLARTQRVDGRWQARALGAQTPADVEQTALALLSILGAGHTEKVGMYKQNVLEAVAWLKTRQQRDGAILNEGWTQVDGVTHALASIALSEAAGMAKQPDTILAAQKAIDCSMEIFQTGHGYDRSGFARHPGCPADLFTTTLFAMVLKSARSAGLNVDHGSLEGIIKFLDTVEDKEHHTYSFVPFGKSSPRAAILGVVGRQFLGWQKEDLRETVAVTLKELGEPTVLQNDSDILFNYFGTLAAFQQGGEIWKNWNERLKANVVGGQIRRGPANGAWAPKGVWAGAGHVLSSALNALALEVYYRYLPMYR